PPPPPEPTPVPARTRVPPPRYATRLALGYEGTEFAKSHFQSGLALEVSVRGPEQFYGGVGLTWATTVEVDQPLSFEVSRLPVRALAGYRHRLDPVWLDGELGLGVDILSRETAVEQPAVPPDLASVSPEGDSTRLLYVLSPRARVELPVVPPMGVHAVVGIDVLLNNFSYVSDSGDEFELLRPRRVRVLVGVGLAFYP
ncbi:MAG: hypothetical protein OXT09_11740, partial [Myxococcales bacterium]|nr:hypothetical protein [Myxococcales bacterium]